jgi:hypothetical protein
MGIVQMSLSAGMVQIDISTIRGPDTVQDMGLYKEKAIFLNACPQQCADIQNDI